MPLATDVKISVNWNPQFPKRCVVCSGEAPDARMSVGDLTVGWFSFWTDIPEGWGSVTVPVHTSCKKPFRLRRWLSRIAFIVIAFVLWWFFGEWIDSILPVSGRNVGRKVLLILMMLPVFLIEVIFPPRFDITVEQYYVTFHFADAAYALEFAKQNREMKRYEEILGEMRS